MTNVFTDAGINRLSYSALEAIRQNFYEWLTQQADDVRGEPNLPMIAGSVAEKAIEFGLLMPDAKISMCEEIARKEFHHRTTFEGFSEDVRQARLDTLCGYGTASKSYPGMVANGVKALRPYGIPSDTQVRIETSLKGIPIPIIGFKDFSYDHHGIDIDLKTTSKMPKIMSPSHQLQGAIYWHASNNRTQRFCYVTKSEAKILELDTYAAEQAIHEATAIAHTLMRLLEKHKTLQELMKYIVPNWGDYRWSPQTRAKAMDVWEENLKASLV